MSQTNNPTGRIGNHPLVQVVVPVYNEGHILAYTIAKLIPFLDFHVPRYEIIIADNGSTDQTLAVAAGLQARHERLKVLHLNEKGRGGAVKRAWRDSDADILTYMDVDLSSDLDFFPSLIKPLLLGKSDLAIGSRLAMPELTRRCFKREIISRGYNLLVKSLFRTHFSDAQCGFKAITRAAAQELLPRVEDDAWFFDTEVLVIAEKLGYRIFDLPVRWTEAPSSTVRIWRTVLDDVRGLIRLKRRPYGRAFHSWTRVPDWQR